MAEHLKNALTAFEANVSVISSGKVPAKKLTSPSFYMGLPGLYTMGSLIYREMGKEEETKNCYKKVMEGLKLCSSKETEDELLYGKAGYLYCLLKLHMCDKVRFNCQAEIVKVANLLKTQGTSVKLKDMLCYTFPKGGKKMYFGAAHGLMGILYVLIEAIITTRELSSDKELVRLVGASSEYMLSQQYPSGNFPSSQGSEGDRLVHFCHGAPGAIPFLLAAHRLFKREEYMAAAVRAGQVVWERGILYKGNGLCHGITGNALSLHSLYRATGDEQWRYRSRMLIDASWNPEIQTTIQNHDDSRRLAMGMADTPYSLMEGMGGTAVLYADLLSKEELIRFPGYEL
eukprot:TRINITY_DN474_c0_g3_i1.p1 TRINITY_DN474_c0_g3~~TRINITY_DN474_c0_g3_i1.p1  ORF type:complete len:344 (-),score=77.59 TRINITY_DN474_c0_g3_i1:10-1041(-)